METSTTEKMTTENGCTMFAHSKRIHGALSIVLILLAAFLFAQTIKSFKEYRYVGGGVPPSNVITVSGEGEIFAVPDTAEFTFTILEEAKTSAEVQKSATDKANEAIKALTEKGIEEKDIKTIGYNLYPKYEWTTDYSCVRYPCDKNQKQVGFELSQSITVKVRDIDKAGELLELVTGKGVSSVSGLTFTVADEDSIQAEVRKIAIDDAKAKADKLASDLGVALVRIVGFSEGGEYMPKMMYAMDSVNESSMAYGLGGADVSATLPAGENRMVSNVSITYEIR